MQYGQSSNNESSTNNSSPVQGQQYLLYGIIFSVLVFLVTLGSFAVYDQWNTDSVDQDMMTALGTDESDSDEDDCNAIGINLHGGITTYIPDNAPTDEGSDYFDVVASERISGILQSADSNPDIKGVLVEVDSGGGAPVAGEEIANTIATMEKPVIAYIRGQGLSAAYWAVSSADRIFASRNSDVGSIGVTMSYLEGAPADKRFVQLSSGKFKDAGNPDKLITDAEREYFMRDVMIMSENFISAIARNRNMSIDAVRTLADGSSMLGQAALGVGLVDEIGGYSEARQYLAQKIGVAPDLCWY